MTPPLPIFCPSCHKPGEIVETSEGVRPSEGFVFDEIKVPTCEVCCVPAGVRMKELAG